MTTEYEVERCRQSCEHKHIHYRPYTREDILCIALCIVILAAIMYYGGH